jgi:uncharacterized membrane protein YgaE (UPF0421/DUF939 family)
MRFSAFVVALIVAYGCFSMFGYQIRGFIIYLIFYICICQLRNWQNALTLNAVLISHFVAYGTMNDATIKNEICIFLIGTGFGVLANLHLRKQVDYIETLKTEADEQIVGILSRMSERIMNKDISDYNGDCFIALKRQIRKAKNVAEENYNNQFRKDDMYDKEYILMRERQYHVLYEMYRNVRTLHSQPNTAQRISEFMQIMADVFHKENDGVQLMEAFWEMDADMKKHPLPITRKEFEDRARLFVLMRNIEEFIQIKIDFINVQQKM